MEIVKAQLEDIKAVKALADISLKAAHSVEYFEQKLGCFFYLAKEKDKILGFIIIDGLTVLLLVVEPGTRRQGVASSMVDFALKQFQQIFLKVRESNKAAIDFYRKTNWAYKGTAPHAFRNGEAGLIFTKKAQNLNTSA